MLLRPYDFNFFALKEIYTLINILLKLNWTLVKFVRTSCYAVNKNSLLINSFIIPAFFHRTEDDWRIVCRLYRGPLLVILFLYLWGINIYGWRSSGVNHVLIFEMDPRNHLSEQHIIELASIFGVVWSISVLSFLYSSALGIPAYANPLILFIVMILFLLNPTKTFRHEARFWTLRIIVSLTSNYEYEDN